MGEHEKQQAHRGGDIEGDGGVCEKLGGPEVEVPWWKGR